jgi:hypothetical protein
MTQKPATTPVYMSGEGKRFALYRLSGVSSGDQYDVAGEFSRVDYAAAYAPSSMKSMTVDMTIAGTVVTMANALLDRDVVYLSVSGAAA